MAHKRELESKLLKEKEECEKKRLFKAQPMPNYDKLKIEIMPSDKPLTQSLRPVFHADFLPPARKSVEPKRSSDSPLAFKF